MEAAYMPYEQELLKASASGDLEKMQIYLALGASLKAKDEKGNTALLCAAHNNRLHAIEWLIEKKQVDPNEKNHAGNSALLFAAYNGFLPAAQYLVDKRKVSLRTKNDNHDTALLYAAINNKTQFMEWLLNEKSVPIDETNKSKHTALIYSLKHGHVEQAIWLVKKGANFKAKNDIGNTAFLIAAMKGHLSFMKWLKEHKQIDLEEENNNRETALIVAAKSGQLAIIQWLISQGANINHRDSSEQTAQRIAKDLSHSAIDIYLTEQLEIHKQKEQQKKVTFQQELKEVSTLSRLRRIPLRESQQLFNQLEQKAKAIANNFYSPEFYKTRGDFYDWLASQENDNSLGNQFYDNAINDYNQALLFDRTLIALENRIQKIRALQGKINPPPQPPQNTLLFKAAAVPKTPPFRPQFFKPAAPKTPLPKALPPRPKISPEEFARLGNRFKNLGSK
jgi:ankyrin repeat protein